MTANGSYQQLRVFVSSTFNDMQQERNVLLEKVFPLVCAHCRERKAEFIGVDLRWGVSEEQSRRGETVSICMAEIDRCRPLFIGMIGERYGWIPEGSPVSVTEQEILYGALEAPAGTEAFFYLRDPALTGELCGPFEPDPHQEALKRKIRESGFPVLDGYRDLDSFARQVCADLIGAVDRLTEATAILSPTEALRGDQLFLARRYAANTVERPKQLQALRALLEQGGLTLLTGEPGAGKTALLAEWALENAAREDCYTFLYFIGSAADKGWELLARQLIEELCARFSLELPEAEDPEGLRRALYLVLHMAARKERIYLALDQLDALALDDGFGLSWLPEELPEGVSVLVTLEDGDALSRLRLRDHRELRLTPLAAEEAVRVAERYLAAHSKTLSLRQIALIRESPRVRNPLFLITLLNEIRHIGRYFELTEQIEDYLSCAGLPELFDKVLSRLDQDYDEDGNALPRRLLLLLEASRGGLTDNELMALLGDLPYALIAPLRLALEPFTAVSGGALHVSVPEFRRAIRRHYALAEREIRDCRREMAAWFSDHRDTPRRSYVLPWLLRETGEHEALLRVLSEPGCFAELWRRNRYETKEYWSGLASRGFRPAEAYRQELDAPEKADCGLLAELAEFFADLGEAAGARSLSLYLTAPDSPAEPAQRALAYGLLGNLYQREGQYARAVDCYRQKLALARELGDRYEQERAQGNLGLIALNRGDPLAARRAFEQVLELAVSLNQRDAQQVALGNLGNIAFSLGEIERARELYQREKNISLDSGNTAGLINACGALGVLYSRERRFQEAEAEFAMQEKQSRKIGAADGLANALGNLAALAQMRGEADKAEALLLEKRELCRQSGQVLGEQSALGNLAQLAAARDDHPLAWDYARQRAELTRRCRAFRPYAQALLQLAAAEQALGREEEAKQHRLQALSIARQHGFRL